MNNNFYLNKPFINIFEKPNKSSKISSQILYGEKFKIISKNKKYLKIKTTYDKYLGYIKNEKYPKNFVPNYKVKVLKARIYRKPENSRKTIEYLSFSSEICVSESNSTFFKFDKNKWIKKSDVINKNNTTNNYLKIFNLFKRCKYIWGGKTFKGIDCSALIQVYYKFNNKFFPRDSVDQINFRKGKKIYSKFKTGDIIFWKGHVAVCVNQKNLIHAYGPMKKVVIMPIDKTIKIIKETAGLKIKKVFSI